MAAGAAGFWPVTGVGRDGPGPGAATSEGLLTEVGPWVEPRGLEVGPLRAATAAAAVEKSAPCSPR